MSTGSSGRRTTTRRLLEMKERGEKIVALTAYDYLFARLVDEAGVDVVLVGDSLGQVVLGHETTLPVTLDDMIHHARAARRGIQHALLVVDMPFLSFHVAPDQTIRNAGRLLAETGAEAVKLEGGSGHDLRARGAPGERGDPRHGPHRAHAPVGARPGRLPGPGARRRGRRSDPGRGPGAGRGRGASASCWSCCPRSWPPRSRPPRTSPPSGSARAPCDGQILVLYDMLGLNEGFQPRFLRRFADLAGETRQGPGRVRGSSARRRRTRVLSTATSEDRPHGGGAAAGGRGRPGGARRLRVPARDGVIGFVAHHGVAARGAPGAGGPGPDLTPFVVMSIFVNPTQFGPAEDFESYPRDLDRDAELAEARGVAIAVRAVGGGGLPGGDPVVRVVPGRLADRLCGASRPGHFEGVLTVVAKLFGMVQPDVAVFGQKDYQQATLIRRMVRDLDMAGAHRSGAHRAGCGRTGTIVAQRVPVADARARAALSLSAGLFAARDAFEAGVADVDRLKSRVRGMMRDAGVEPEYIELVQPGYARAGGGSGSGDRGGGGRPGR
jgi:3-methyl-2-oxobutanoate hydroxymethyltransferase